RCCRTACRQPAKQNRQRPAPKKRNAPPATRAPRDSSARPLAQGSGGRPNRHTLHAKGRRTTTATWLILRGPHFGPKLRHLPDPIFLTTSVAFALSGKWGQKNKLR